MGSLRDFTSAVFMDATPEEKARLLRLSFRVITTVFMVWSVGGLMPFGMEGFARADAVSKARSAAIAAAVDPLKDQIAEVADKLDKQDTVLKAIRVEQLGSKLRDLHELLCVTQKPDSLDRIAQEIENTQREYRLLTGERYPSELCRQ